MRDSSQEEKPGGTEKESPAYVSNMRIDGGKPLLTIPERLETTWR